MIDKLSELIDTVFRMPTGKGDDQRVDKATSARHSIGSVSPVKLSRSAGDTTVLTITGSGFVAGSVVSVAGTVLIPTKITATTLSVELLIETYVDQSHVDVVDRAGGPAGPAANTVSMQVVP